MTSQNMSAGDTNAERRRSIIALVRADPGLLGLPVPSDSESSVRVCLLGAGESYRVWRVQVTPAEGGPFPTSVVLRVARRPIAELPKSMAAEFAAMLLVPSGIGPRPVRLEESAERLGAPFIVTDLVWGRPVSPQGWTTALLTAHARQMALLHAETYTAWGEITAPIEQRAPTLDLTARFAETLASWQREHPRLFALSDVARLLPRVETFVADAAPVFRRLRRFTLIHGDLGMPNVVVDHKGVPRYVDWQFARIDDPAFDLANLGGAVPALPWYSPLDPARVNLLLRTYLEATRGSGETLRTLWVRRDAWEVYERFFSSLYFRVRSSEDDPRSSRYTSTVLQLTAGLDARLN